VRRIAVLGCSGSGKSRLSRALGERLDLPVIHLDAQFWRPGWVQTPVEEWEARQESLFAGDSWVADGNFHATLAWRLARADTVVHLDFPRYQCFRGVLMRLVRQWGQVREDMGAGCPEGVDFKFLRWVWNFRRDVRPEVLRMLGDFKGRVISLHSRSEVAAFLRQVEDQNLR
jgi:adenylate kinase family enzyme